jgi:hypothetical protein
MTLRTVRTFVAGAAIVAFLGLVLAARGSSGEGLVAFGAGWFALSPSGSQVSASSSNTRSGNGLGY